MSKEPTARSLTNLLDCSKTLRNILGMFMKEIQPLEIKVGELKNGSGMQTFMDGPELSITINQDYLNKDGEFIHFEKKGYVDNGGYVHEGTVADTFAAAFAHESLHARHYYWYNQAKEYRAEVTGSINNKDYWISVQYLRKHGFSEEFINIFYSKRSGGGWSPNDGSVIEDREHEYFRKYEQETIRQVSYDYQRSLLEFQPDE